jgi:hypothetical protein
MLVISGGALGDLGAITAAEMASYDDQRYLFAAGPGGVVVLSRNNIGGLTFKKIGNYSMVRKIIHDGPYVYVLTDKQVDRIDLHSLTYKGIENLHTVTCALVPAENYRVVSFTDLVVSGKFALLGTSRGLYRIGNNCDISNPTLTESNQLSWTEVAIPQGLTSVVKLCPVSTTGRAQDVAQGVGGIVYVVNGSVGKNQSRLHRFAVKGTDYIEIDDTTIQPIRDCYLGSNNKEGIPTYFINLGEYAHLCCLEGASLLFGRNQQGKDKAYLHALPYDSNIPVGIRSSTPRYHATSVPSMALNVDSATTITSVVRNSITGSILVGGNFGLRANE